MANPIEQPARPRKRMVLVSKSFTISTVYADVHLHPLAELRKLVQHGFNQSNSSVFYTCHVTHLHHITVS